MEKLLEKLMRTKERENEIKNERLAIEEEIYTKVMDQIVDDKSLTIKTDRFKLSVKPNYAVSVDQEAAARFPASFKCKYELSYSQYKKAEGTLDDFVTIKINKPTFSCELIGE